MAMILRRISNSLVTRLILFGIVLVISGGVARYFLLAKFIQEDLTAVVSAQQLALAEAVAKDVDYKIVDRRRLLDRLAMTLPTALLQQPEKLQAWLAERYQLNPVFSLGLVVADTDGIIIADFPQLAGRRGSSIAQSPDFQRARSGKAGIGKPQLGPFSGQAVLPMGVPLTDSRGTVQAVLIGITALAAPDFLDRITQGRIGETGGFLLVSPRDRLFVAAGDPGLVLKPTPADGVVPLHDRAMNGFRGSGMTTNAKGVEELSAIVGVPSTGWFVVARLPTAEAFSPVERVRGLVIRHSFTAIAIVLFVAGFFIRWMLRPLHHAANLADRMTHGEIPLEPLPIVRNDEVGHFTKAFNQLLAKLSNSQAELERMAHHDALTGLPNRTLLADRMQQGLARAQRNHTRIALLFLDLDGFKPINDRLGHGAGDLALQEIARRLAGVIRQCDTLARIGGDEFVLLVTDLADQAEEGVARLAKKCIAIVSQPLQLENTTCTLGVSIGIALSDGGGNADQILIAADKAMYEAKKNGRGGYVIATDSASLLAEA